MGDSSRDFLLKDRRFSYGRINIVIEYDCTVKMHVLTE
uniref:Uncharacterized protein n=1 Tax=Arundo donax TaxID=35708 RepID=A0A0A8ZFK6_ARUDO